MNNNRFIYKEIDQEGLYTLEAISASNNLNRWVYCTIKPFLKGDILEIGSGIGNITQFVLDDKFILTASDIRENYCSILHSRFGLNSQLQGIRNINIVHPEFEDEYHDLLEKFDTIFALNIIEHVEDDLLAIKNCRKLLRKNGIIIILVPAFQLLYNGFDIELHHFRRYTKSSLGILINKADFKTTNTQYFNLIGILGWWFSGSILSNRILPQRQLDIFNRMVPFFKLFDRLIFRKLGLSVISVGEKK